MTALKSAQAAFQAHVLTGDEVVLPLIVGDERASAGERLDVYYQAYRLRLIDVLGNDFDGLRALLGDDFSAMARAYIDAHPSQHPSVRWFGRRLAGFLAGAPPWSARPELAEMAAFEWAWGQVFDAAEAKPLPASELEALEPRDWPGLRLEFQPAQRRLTLRWNVPAIYTAIAAGETPPPAEQAAPTEWLLWRQDLVVKWRSLSPAEACAVDAAQRGEDFATLCAGLCAHCHEEEVPGTAAGLLRRWLADGLISAVHPGRAAPAC